MMMYNRIFSSLSLSMCEHHAVVSVIKGWRWKLDSDWVMSFLCCNSLREDGKVAIGNLKEQLKKFERRRRQQQVPTNHFAVESVFNWMPFDLFLVLERSQLFPITHSHQQFYGDSTGLLWCSMRPEIVPSIPSRLDIRAEEKLTQ